MKSLVDNFAGLVQLGGVRRRCSDLNEVDFGTILNPLVPLVGSLQRAGSFYGSHEPQFVTGDNDSPPGSRITNLTNKQAGCGINLRGEDRPGK